MLYIIIEITKLIVIKEVDFQISDKMLSLNVEKPPGTYLTRIGKKIPFPDKYFPGCLNYSSELLYFQRKGSNNLFCFSEYFWSKRAQ